MSQETATAPQSPVADLVSQEAYQRSREHIFRTMHSWHWHVRAHRPELVKAGALVAVGGRLLVHPSKADQVALEVGQQQAAKSLR